METNNPYQAPVATTPQQPALKLTAAQTLFSFTGRIPRRTYWLYYLLTMVVAFVVIGLLTPTMVKAEDAAPSTVQVESPASIVGAADAEMPAPAAVNPAPIIVMVILMIPLIWIGLALQVKRWHDRNKSGAWVLISMIPLIGPVWTFVEAGCLRGTLGDNSYGADPT